MSTRSAHITGPVEYREGDGPNIAIRPGPVEIEETELDVILSWSEGEARGSAAIPLADYRRHVETGAIRLGDH